jgi:hypothetical protein
MVGRTDIENALQTLDKLTQEEARMAAAEVLKATRHVDDRVRGVGDRVLGGSLSYSNGRLYCPECYMLLGIERLRQQIASEFGDLNRS